MLLQLLQLAYPVGNIRRRHNLPIRWRCRKKLRTNVTKRKLSQNDFLGVHSIPCTRLRLKNTCFIRDLSIVRVRTSWEPSVVCQGHRSFYVPYANRLYVKFSPVQSVLKESSSKQSAVYGKGRQGRQLTSLMSDCKQC